MSDPFTVWMQLRNGNGSVDMQLVIERLPSGELEPVEVIAVTFGLRFKDPNEVVEHEAVFDNGLPLDEEGRYRLRLLADGVAIMERDFTVVRPQT